MAKSEDASARLCASMTKRPPQTKPGREEIVYFFF